MEKRGEPLMEVILKESKFSNKDIMSEDIVVKEIITVDALAASVPANVAQNLIVITIPETPDKPSIWVGPPISSIPSPPILHVDSTELNSEIVESHVKGPNLEVDNLGEK